MPVVIFHGDNTALINTKIDEMKKSYPVSAIERFSLKSESFEQLLMKISTPSFFDEQRLLIVDDTEEKKIETTKLITDSSTTVVLSFGKELPTSSTVLKWAQEKNLRVVGISQPQDKRIFTFLDLLAEKNVKALSMLDDLIDDFGCVYLLTMIIFLLRRLVLPLGNAPSFLEAKLKKQKSNFSEQNLISLYERTLLTEYQFKTGKIEERTGMLLLINFFLEKN
jgi:DNA polymerase III delta subunit